MPIRIIIYGERPLYHEDDIMMAPNNDNKAEARSARTTPFAITKSIMKSADSAVITSQTSIYRVQPLSSFPASSKREIHSSSELVRLCVRETQVLYLGAAALKMFSAGKRVSLILRASILCLSIFIFKYILHLIL